MNILSINSSTRNLSLAVLEDDRVIKFSNEEFTNNLSDHIMKRITSICRKAQLALNDINGIAVGLGPGSFTSLRVGLATAKGIAFNKSIPLVGISSLDACVLNVRTENADVCVVSDAKRDKVYFCRYRKTSNKIRKTEKEQLLPLKALLKMNLNDTVIVGDAVFLIKDMVSKRFKDVVFEAKKNSEPQAKHIGHLAWDKFQSKKFNDINRIKPLYLYAQDCQVRK